MKIGILKYPGGHGEVELMHMLSGHFKKDVREIWYKETGPFDVDILFLGGGFPCSESNTGLTCLDDSSVLQYLSEFASQGKYIIGVGNGFQLLCDALLLPGKLVKNSSGRFICKQVFIKPENHNNVFTGGLELEKIFRIPIASNYGRYVADEAILMKMRQDEQILFRFCDYEGRITEAVNYTGSVDNIAMVCNSEKNVFGMIAQPERSIGEFLADTDGSNLLSSFLDKIPL
jgi:phosphoribosylformylglycinamidine synthase I